MAMAGRGPAVELQSKVREDITLKTLNGSLAYANPTQFHIYLPWVDICLA